MDTYTDTWGKMVKLILIKKFFNKEDFIYTMHPDFENIEFAELESEIVSGADDVEYNEEDHLDGASEMVRQIYNELKTELLKAHPSLIFNPKKHYISIRKERNIAFFITARKKIRLVVLQSYEITKKEITEHPIKSLTPGVQKFWNGPSCAIIIETTEHLGEVKTLLDKLVSNTK